MVELVGQFAAPAGAQSEAEGAFAVAAEAQSVATPAAEPGGCRTAAGPKGFAPADIVAAAVALVPLCPGR